MHWTARRELLTLALLALLASAGTAGPAFAHAPPDEQLADVERRIAADPGDPALYLERAALRGERGETAAALADCATARGLVPADDPESASVDLAEARVLLAAGRVEPTLELLDGYLVRRPSDAAARVDRARGRRLVGRLPEALDDYRRALDAAPGAGPDLFRELARGLRAAGRPQEALETLREALRRFGRVPALENDARELALRLGVPIDRPDSGSHAAPTAPPLLALGTVPAPAGLATVVRGPYLQIATPTSVVVRWRTDAPVPDRVRFGTADGGLDQIAGSGALTTDHEVTLTGLAPETRYAYEVAHSGEGADDPPGAEPVFRTPPRAGDDRPVRVWVVGDSGTADESARAVRDAYRAVAAADRPADLWLMLGDNAYPTGTEEQYQAAVFDTYADELASLPLWPAIGNHDAASADPVTGTGVYFDLFSLPRGAEAGGVPSGTEAYYSFDHGPIHFVCLDSHGTDRSQDGAMIAWLRADLAATTAPWIVAYWHHPPYSKGSHDSDTEARMVEMRERFLPVLEAYGVDLVLAGHSHSYERSVLIDGHYGLSDTLTPAMVLDGGDGRTEAEGGDGAYEKPSLSGAHEGTVYAVAGSSGRVGGGPLDHPVMTVSLRELGSLILDVEGRELRGSFLREDGTVDDGFTILQGPPPFPDEGFTDPTLPGFRFAVRISAVPGESRPGVAEGGCLPETVCVSGAVAGRTEVLLRIVGPKPNGYLWPTLVKLTTSRVEIWIEQVATGELRYYLLPGTTPGDDRLDGRFDRRGFRPEP